MNVLFVCKGNVGRSQIAQELCKKRWGNAHRITSAGTALSGPEEPLKNLLPHIQEVLDVMCEEGIDVSENIRRQLTEEIAIEADKIIVIMEKESILPEYLAQSKKIVRWEVADPKGQDLKTTLQIKDEIKSFLDTLNL